MAPRQLRDHELREGTRAGDGIVEVVDDAPEVVDEVADIDVPLVEDDVLVAGQVAGVGALVVGRVERELAVEGHEVAGPFVGGEAGDDAGIEAAD